MDFIKENIGIEADIIDLDMMSICRVKKDHRPPHIGMTGTYSKIGPIPIVIIDPYVNVAPSMNGEGITSSA